MDGGPWLELGIGARAVSQYITIQFWCITIRITIYCTDTAIDST